MICSISVVFRLVLVGSAPAGIGINMTLHHSLSYTVILKAALFRSNWATLHCNKATECTGLKQTLFPYVFKNRALEKATLRVSRLLRFNDYPVTPQRITASNWLLKLAIANHIHYLTSACVILVINKAWHLPFASSKTPRKTYQGLQRRFLEQALSGQLSEAYYITKEAQYTNRNSPSHQHTSRHCVKQLWGFRFTVTNTADAVYNCICFKISKHYLHKMQ